ncbi:HAD family hydrolase [soil metagenome]
MHLIFDFDGTIVDSFPTVIETFNILADKYNFQKIPLDEVAVLRDLSSRQLINHLKIPMYKIPWVLYQARKQMYDEMPRLASFANLPEVLQKLYNANFSLGILTSNSLENVSTWLDMNGMTHLFRFIDAKSTYFGKSRLIKKTLKRYAINKTKTFYIGDETRDIDAAKQNGIYSIAVTWGFNSEKILSQHNPHYIARQPADILKICGLP